MSNQIAKENLYNVEWQKIRVSLLSYFPTVEGTKRNINILQTYLKSPKDDYDEYLKLWRVINLLNAVRMGYSGQGIADSEQDDLIVDFRSGLQTRYQELKQNGLTFKHADWTQIKTDLEELYKSDKASFDKIYENLNKRIDFSMKKIGTVKFRDSLVRFVGLMTDITQ